MRKSTTIAVGVFLGACFASPNSPRGNKPRQWKLQGCSLYLPLPPGSAAAP